MIQSTPVSILICGDICPLNETRVLFDEGDPRPLLGSLVDVVRAADLSIANLECVLSDTPTATEKIGPVLIGKPDDAKLLAAAGFDLVGLANNHIKDCGERGVLDTLAACQAAGLQTTGAGPDAVMAAEPARINVNGWIIGVMAVAEHEFNAASATSAGAHVFDALVDLERLRALKDSCDFVILLYHGGIEFYPYPSPLLQRTCRSFIRNGADLVLCQHSHVIGTQESYEHGNIIYGQGNSVFGYRHGQPTWNEGIAVSVSLEREKPVKARIALLPTRCNMKGQVDLMEETEADSCLRALLDRSSRAEDPVWVEESWSRFCNKLSKNQLPHLLGLGLWMTRLNRLLNGALVRAFLSRKRQMITLNVVRCSSHRDVILTSLENDLNSRDSGSAYL